jgi:hypothetical protein
MNDTSDKQLVNYYTKETDANVTFLDELDTNRIDILQLLDCLNNGCLISIKRQYQKANLFDSKW